MPHIHGDADNEAEWLDMLLGRGAGDPDAHGYPGDKPESIKYVGQDKPKVELHHADSEILDLGEVPF